MSFFKKVTSTIQIREPKLTRRLFTDGWESTGHVKREPDTRTTKQLLENIDYFAEKCPEVAQFKKELKEINQKHLGLVSDIFQGDSTLDVFLQAARTLSRSVAGSSRKYPVQSNRLIGVYPNEPITGHEETRLARSLLTATPSFVCKPYGF